VENYVLIEGDLYFVYANNYFIKVTEHFAQSKTLESIFVDHIEHIAASA